MKNIKFLARNLTVFSFNDIFMMAEMLKEELQEKLNKMSKENILNKTPSKGKVLQGKCPDELWSEEFAVKKVIAKDSLKLFCM